MLTTQKVVNDRTTQKVFGAILPEPTPLSRFKNKLNMWYSHGVVAFWDNVKGSQLFFFECQFDLFMYVIRCGP